MRRPAGEAPGGGAPPDRRARFEAMADRWDAQRERGTRDGAVLRGLDLVAPLDGRVVVDLGCGTGLLETHLVPRLSGGRVVAVDYAAAMLDRARARCPSAAVDWLCADVHDTGLPDSCADVVLCFDAWPHFDDPDRVAAEMARWLRPGGRALVWHDIGRARLAQVHAGAGGAVAHDVLPPVGELAGLLARHGLETVLAEEDEASYTLLARRAGPA